MKKSLIKEEAEKLVGESDDMEVGLHAELKVMALRGLRRGVELARDAMLRTDLWDGEKTILLASLNCILTEFAKEGPTK